VNGKKLRPAKVSLQPLRERLVWLSALSMFLTLLLFPILYVFQPPLEFQDFLRLLQQILPIFIGYLASAIGYAFSTRTEQTIPADRFRMIQFILIVSFSLYWFGMALTAGFYVYSHSSLAPLGAGMSKEILFGMVTVMLTLITGMAGLISTKIFVDDDAGRASNNNAARADK